MEYRLIEIELPQSGISSTVVENAGNTGEHNATCLAIKVPEGLKGENISYYIEYSNRRGEPSRTPFLDFDAETSIVYFLLPLEITLSIKTECFFVAVYIEDGETKIKSKPYKIILNFSVSPNADVIYEENQQNTLNAILDLLKKAKASLPFFVFPIDSSQWTYTEPLHSVTLPLSLHHLGFDAALFAAERENTNGVEGVVCSYKRLANGSLIVYSSNAFNGRLYIQAR